MKKILYVFPSLGAGGAEKAAILVANQLRSQYKYNVTFFTFTFNLYYKKLLDPEIELIQNDLYNKSTRFQRIFSTYVRYVVCLNRFLKQRDFDIVVSGYEFDPELPIMQLKILSLLMLSRRKERFISILQNSLKGMNRPHSKSRNRFVLAIISYLRLFVFDGIIVVSNRILEEIPRFGQKRVVVIPNPVDQSYVLRRSKIKIPTLHHTFVRTPYLINVARISWQKNQLCLLKAFNFIKRETNENLVLVGYMTDKEYYDELQEFIEENYLSERVLYVGTPENHYPYLRKADAFVFSSRYEGHPLAVLEAMALKIPIISTKYIGYDGLLSEKNSILVEPEDDKQLAAAMLAITNKKVNIDILVQNAYKQIALFDVSEISRKYHQYFGAST